MAFSPPPPPCNVVPQFELPIENKKHPNFEWGTGGCAFFCSLKLPYLSTMSQQFCRRFLVHTGAENCKLGQIGASLCKVMK